MSNRVEFVCSKQGSSATSIICAADIARQQRRPEQHLDWTSFCTEDACTEIDILCTEVDCTDISYVPKVTVQILTFNVLKPAAPKKHVPKVYVPKLSCTESDVPLTYSVADLQQVCSGAGRNNLLRPSGLVKPTANKRIERVFRWCPQAGQHSYIALKYDI